MTAHKAIEDLVRALETAWNHHDAHAFAEAFAEDADFTNVFGMVQKGRACASRSFARAACDPR